MAFLLHRAGLQPCRAGKPAHPPQLHFQRWVRYAYPPYELNCSMALLLQHAGLQLCRAGKPAHPPQRRFQRWVRYAYPPYELNCSMAFVLHRAGLQRIQPRRAALQQFHAAIVVLLLQNHVKSPQAMHMLQHLATALVQWRTVLRNVAQSE